MAISEEDESLEDAAMTNGEDEQGRAVVGVAVAATQKRKRKRDDSSNNVEGTTPHERSVTKKMDRDDCRDEERGREETQSNPRERQSAMSPTHPLASGEPRR